jgi:hypothetical protein
VTDRGTEGIQNRISGDVREGSTSIQAHTIENLNVEVHGSSTQVMSGDTPPMVVTSEVGERHRDDPLWLVGGIEDGDIDRVPRPYSPEWTEWLREHRVDLPLYDRLNLHVEGTSPQAVMLRQLRFRVVERSAPQGTVLTATRDDYGVGAALIPRWFSVRLGADAVAVPQPQFTGEPDFPFTVQQSDPEWFVIDLYWGTEDLAWVVELDWKCVGQSGTLRVDNGGSPFRSTTIHGRPIYCWNVDRPRLGWRPPNAR